jgi:hypothetical protein
VSCRVPCDSEHKAVFPTRQRQCSTRDQIPISKRLQHEPAPFLFRFDDRSRGSLPQLPMSRFHPAATPEVGVACRGYMRCVSRSCGFHVVNIYASSLSGKVRMKFSKFMIWYGTECKMTRQTTNYVLTRSNYESITTSAGADGAGDGVGWNGRDIRVDTTICVYSLSIFDSLLLDVAFRRVCVPGISTHMHGFVVRITISM